MTDTTPNRYGEQRQAVNAMGKRWQAILREGLTVQQIDTAVGRALGFLDRNVFEYRRHELGLDVVYDITSTGGERGQMGWGLYTIKRLGNGRGDGWMNWHGSQESWHLIMGLIVLELEQIQEAENGTESRELVPADVALDMRLEQAWAVAKEKGEAPPWDQIENERPYDKLLVKLFCWGLDYAKIVPLIPGVNKRSTLYTRMSEVRRKYPGVIPKSKDPRRGVIWNDKL